MKRKKCIKLICFLCFAIINFNYGFSQISNSQILKIADGVISDSLGSDFNKEIEFIDVFESPEKGFWLGFNIDSLTKLDFESDFYQDTVNYIISYKPRCNNCGITNEIQDYRPAIFSVSLFAIGNSFFLDTIGDPELVYSMNKQFINNRFISAKEALLVADLFKPKRTRTTKYKPQLTYYTKSDNFIWRITRFKKGHSIVTEYTLAIDAVSGELLEISKVDIKRGFFNAIGDWFTGFY